VPESRPIRSGGASAGSMALLNTVANSAPIVPTMKPARAMPIAAGSPGRANHSSVQPAMSSAPKAAIHGFLGPVASAMAPSAGEVSAMASPAAPVA
jgi:hypothetical protein